MPELVLAGIGDIALSKPIGEDLSEALDVLRRADVAIGNLEAPFTAGGEAADKWVTLRQDPALVEEYVKIGFKVLNIANNHMLDYGLEGLLTTIETLRRRGIEHIGGGLNIDEALRYKTIEKNGIKLAFIGCASTLPGASIAGKTKPGLAPLRVRTTYYIEPEMEKEQPGTPPVIFTVAVKDDIDRLVDVILDARAEAEHVVVSIHWGLAYQESILEYQPQAARAFVDAGARLVLGHHPHRIQGVEKYRDGFIFYSLGDFFLDTPYMAPVNTRWRHWPPKFGMWAKSDDSLIVRAVFRSGGDVSIEALPCSHRGSEQPKILVGSEALKLLAYLKELSVGCEFIIEGDRAILR